MAWQWNPKRGDITDPDVPLKETGMSKESYAYYGGELIAESVRAKNGNTLAQAKNMLALLKDYVVDDPCAANDPRYKRAVEIIERIEKQV